AGLEPTNNQDRGPCCRGRLVHPTAVRGVDTPPPCVRAPDRRLTCYWVLVMCVAIALAYSELPLSFIEEHGLDKRVHDRGGEKEVRFYWQAAPALLPVWWDGQLRIVRWGNRDRAKCKLPPTGWTWQETIEEGKWFALAPEPVVIPATYGLMNG